MTDTFAASIKGRIDKLHHLTQDGQGASEWIEAGTVSLTILHDTLGGAHPLCSILDTAIKKGDWTASLGASRTVITLFEQGGLTSPRLAIAHEIEGDLMNIAQGQAELAEKEREPEKKQLRLAISAFMIGAALEDGLRRLCDAKGISYEAGKTTIAKLQTTLYQPSKGLEVISSSENKQITTWGDTRNKADHGHFNEITQTEVIAMLMGVRALLDKRLP